MREPQARVKGSPVWFRKYQRTQSSHYRREEIGKTDVCPICNKELVVGDTIYLVISNNVLFPNTMIHKDCVVDEDFVAATKKIMDSYNKYKKFFKRIGRIWS